jgi:hypothetical protein
VCVLWPSPREVTDCVHDLVKDGNLCFDFVFQHLVSRAFGRDLEDLETMTSHPKWSQDHGIVM